MTPRELEVLEVMSEGLTTRQMSSRLFIAPVTVRSHIASILHKLNVPDRESAVALLSRNDEPFDQSSQP